MDVTDETKNQIEAELKAARITIKGLSKLKVELHGPTNPCTSVTGQASGPVSRPTTYSTSGLCTDPKVNCRY